MELLEQIANLGHCTLSLEDLSKKSRLFVRVCFERLFIFRESVGVAFVKFRRDTSPNALTKE